MTFQKKEGVGAFSALSTLFGKKNAPQATTGPVDDIPALIGKKTESAAPILTATPKDGITYSEVGAGEQLGISDEDVGYFRRHALAHGHDYIREEGFVRIKMSGIKKIQERINSGDLICVSEKVFNPYKVHARRPGSSEILKVTVASNENWAKGMIMPNCSGPSGSGVYACSAKPRTKGRI
jgi:hypothetical protein